MVGRLALPLRSDAGMTATGASAPASTTVIGVRPGVTSDRDAATPTTVRAPSTVNRLTRRDPGMASSVIVAGASVG